MTVDQFPGEFRVGVLNEPMSGVGDPQPVVLAPKFLVMILLCGRQTFRLEGQEFTLDAGTKDDMHPIGFAIIMDKPCELQFEGSWGAPFRKISIAGPPNWFSQIAEAGDKADALPNFPNRHGEPQIWTPGPEIIRLATQIVFAPPEESQRQLGLFRMSRALEVLRRIPRELELHDEESSNLGENISDLRTVERVRLYIMQDLAQDLSLARLEAKFGLNRRSIQRRFKQEYGIGVNEFVRKARLNLANRALQKDGMTISQAAHIAGYSTNANFSTAFKREYGVSPKGIRNKNV